MATIPVYVLAGQSNAKRIDVLHSVTSAMTDLGGPSVIVHQGYQASGLAPNPGEMDWSPASSGELFDGMLDSIVDAFAAIAMRGDTPVFGGMFWVQGERDAEFPDAAAAYQANLEAFISALRVQFGEAFPFVIAELRTTADPWSYHEDVRAAQHEVAATDPNVVLVETDAFQLSSDLVHYSQSGQISLGEALVGAVAEHHAEITGDNVVVADQILKGQNANDEIRGELGNDKLVGNGGLDKLYGGDGDDTLMGGAAADTLYGGKGNDTLHGGAGNDMISGGDGDDRLFGGLRNDTLHGGEGRDKFFFTATDGANSSDVVLDFVHGTDTIVLRGLALESIEDTAAGAVLHFSTGATALLQGVAAATLDAKDFALQDGATTSVFLA